MDHTTAEISAGRDAASGRYEVGKLIYKLRDTVIRPCESLQIVGRFEELDLSWLLVEAAVMEGCKGLNLEATAKHMSLWGAQILPSDMLDSRPLGKDNLWSRSDAEIVPCWVVTGDDVM